jgi:hypothetical protein
VYASHHDAAAAAHRILWRQFQRKHTVYQRFVVPLEMQVFTAAEVRPDDLKPFAHETRDDSGIQHLSTQSSLRVQST